MRSLQDFGVGAVFGAVVAIACSWDLPSRIWNGDISAAVELLNKMPSPIPKPAKPEPKRII